MKPKLTVEVLRQIVSYDPETGMLQLRAEISELRSTALTKESAGD